MDSIILYRLIYALAARAGREEVLFGTHARRGLEAFLQSAPGTCFPELWFELPLLGEPWFDLHVLTAREELDRTPDPAQCGGYPQVFEWFSGGEHVRQLALSWDLNTANAPAAAIQLLLKETDIPAACEFLQAAGKPEAADAYRTFVSRMPGGWFACYLGVFPSRPGHHLRVECIPDPEMQKAYAEDISLLGRHLSQVGFTGTGDTILPRCEFLAGMPFRFELQFDIEENGKPGDTLGASLRFAIGRETDECQPFTVNGEAGRLMAEVEKWGLADDRWRLLEDTTYAQRVTFGGESRRLYCAPVFVKLRWRGGKPLDAKTYLVAGEQGNS